jgi:hypothetical protein
MGQVGVALDHSITKESQSQTERQLELDQRQWRTAESAQKRVGRPDYFTNCGGSFSLTWHSFHFQWHARALLWLRATTSAIGRDIAAIQKNVLTRSGPEAVSRSQHLDRQQLTDPAEIAAA